MVKGIANLVLRFKRREKLIQLTKRSRKVPSSFSTLLVIVPEEVKLEEQMVIDFANQNNISIKNVTIVVVSKKEMEMPELQIKNSFNFSRTQISFLGRLPMEWDPLFEKSYDLLLNLFTRSSLFTELISASFHAQYRMGYVSVDSRLNDIIFTMKTPNTKQFLSECAPFMNALLKTKK